MKRHLFIGWFVLVSLLLAGCGSDSGPNLNEAPALADGSHARVAIVIPEQATPGLEAAAEDFSKAVGTITGAGQPLAVVHGSAADAATKVVVEVTVDAAAADDLGEQGYRIARKQLAGEHYGLRVAAATDTGAMYGVYEIIADMGVRYFHPEQTFFPSNPTAHLPWDYDGKIERPDFELRGFHEHTQHPIVASDFYLRPDQGFRPLASHYIRWLARNRQNFMSWQMLKTVDLDSWGPYISDIIDEAHGYGIEVGIVVSFVDEQQHSFKIIRDDRLDADGQRLADDEQIRQVLGRLADLGIDSFTIQIGSSEFTKPADQDVLSWLNTAAAFTTEQQLDYFAWIHTTCPLEADDGGRFFDLPLQANPSVGAWVHTTMFYTLESPAPVYGCQDFGAQLDFLDQAAGQRELVYFPETAWWLGFDDNLPLALPLTGWARAYDLQQVLGDYPVRGHVTFTSGREWDYWMYDHFLTRATWDNDFGWSDYLAWIAPMFGERGDALSAALEDWTALQKTHFFDENPLIYFYLAGELAQDEIGQNAGILARRPKLSFRDVATFDQARFEQWKTDDYAMLERMLTQYRAVLDPLPESDPSQGDLPALLYHEAYTTLRVYVMRIEHTLALYGGVIEARAWARADGGTDAQKQQARTAAEAKLDEARAITDEVRQIVAEMESHYRYPVELLTREKPESPTVYPFGYLYETHTAHFWKRRDDQLALLIEQIFSDQDDDWQTEPDHLFVTDSDHAELIVPDNRVAAGVIEGFIPQMLFGLDGDLSTDAAAQLVVAHDYNQNLLPDTDTEASFPIDKSQDPWTATGAQYRLRVRDSAGQPVADGLLLHDPTFALTIGDDPSAAGLPFLEECELAGQVDTDALLDMIVNLAGIDRAGAESLMRSVFNIPDGEPTPDRVPIELRLTFERATPN